MQKVKYYKCPICETPTKYNTLKLWGNHMLAKHRDNIPPGYSIARYFYLIQTGKTHGLCVTCKGHTEWNEVSMKYNRYCNNPECKKAYCKIAKDRMIDKYGKLHKLNEPDHQRKMLQAKKTSGFYQFADGTKVSYASTYENDFLKMLNNFLNLPGVDIIGPSPHTYYYDYKNSNDEENEGRKFYIPDYYIPSLNLEIEIKQQTSTHKEINRVSRVKEKIKDEIMSSNKTVNYIKINDKNYSNFFKHISDANEKALKSISKED